MDVTGMELPEACRIEVEAESSQYDWRFEMTLNLDPAKHYADLAKAMPNRRPPAATEQAILDAVRRRLVLDDSAALILVNSALVVHPADPRGPFMWESKFRVAAVTT